MACSPRPKQRASSFAPSAEHRSVAPLQLVAHVNYLYLRQRQVLHPLLRMSTSTNLLYFGSNFYARRRRTKTTTAFSNSALSWPLSGHDSGDAYHPVYNSARAPHR